MNGTSYRFPGQPPRLTLWTRGVLGCGEVGQTVVPWVTGLTTGLVGDAGVGACRTPYWIRCTLGAIVTDRTST